MTYKKVNRTANCSTSLFQASQPSLTGSKIRGSFSNSANSRKALSKRIVWMVVGGAAIEGDTNTVTELGWMSEASAISGGSSQQSP